MKHTILGLLGSRRVRSLMAGALAAITAGVIAISAMAGHDEEFQLDGNALSTLCGTVPDCAVQVFDWGKPVGSPNTKNIFNTTDSTATVNTSVVNNANTSGFIAAGFNRDFGVRVSAQDNCSLTNTTSTNFCTADGTTFATGSKDIQNISGGGADQGGNWQCNRDNNVNSKIDLMNAYSTVYIDPSSGDKIIYFGAEKNKDNGNNNIGFWFLQGDANCLSTGPATDFTGNHQNGDVLVTSAFTSGGGVSSILVYRWSGGASGCIDSNPSAAPACDQLPIASGADCKSNPTNHDVCATTNSGPNPTTGNITVPWLTADATLGVGHTVVPPDFFEGGVNITKVFEGLPGGAPSCFNTFLADTRSSQEPTATLFDFSRGVLGECKSTTETTPVDNAGNPIPAAGLDIPKDPADAAIQVRDKATVTVTGVSSFSGTLTFHLCGPFAAGSDTLCTGSSGVAVDTQSITSNGTYTSAAATVTQAGRYCWRASFTSTTTGVPPSSDSRASECFTVNPVKPGLTTQAGAGPVNFGDPVTDTATLVGTAHQPGTGGPSGSTNGSILIPPTGTLGGDATGTITFTLYKDTPGPNNCSVLATGTGTNPQTKPVSGDGTYGPVSFTPDAPGTYRWVASYSGDLPNTQASDPSACLDENEDVVVRRIDTRISTTQKVLPQDSATIESTVAGQSLPAGGTVVFRLYGPAGGNDALANCQAHGDIVGQGGLLYRETDNPVGGGESVTTSTNNTNVFVSDSITVYWRVTYNPNDSSFIGRQSDCVENTAVAFTNDPFPGTVFDPSP